MDKVNLLAEIARSLEGIEKHLASMSGQRSIRFEEDLARRVALAERKRKQERRDEVNWRRERAA